MKFFAAVLAGLTLMIGMATAANALPLSLSVNGTNIALMDDGAGGVVLTTDKALNSFLTLKKWSTNGTGHPALDWPEVLILDVSIKKIAGVTPNVITLLFQDASLSMPGLVPGLSPNAKASYSLTSNALQQPGVSVTDTILYNGQSIGSLSAVTSGSIGLNEAGESFLNVTNPFKISEQITLDFSKASGAGTTTFTAALRIIPTPEPGTMILLGAGCLSLAIYSKRRKNA